MIHIPGQSNGGINHTYGGQVDALPTLLHLLGVDTSNYIQLGQDLFSDQNEQLVAFRDGDFGHQTTPTTAVLIDNLPACRSTIHPMNCKPKSMNGKPKSTKQLSVSDQINNGDLTILREKRSRRS